MGKRFASILIALVCLSVWIVPVIAADQLKTAKQKKTSVDSRLNQVSAEKKRIAQEKKRLEQQRKDIANLQAAENKQYKELMTEICEIEENILQIDQAIVDAEEDYNQRFELTKTRLKVMYENSNASLFDMLVESDDLLDFLEKLQYITLITKNDKKMLEELNQAKEDVEYKKRLREEEKGNLQDKLDQKKKRLNTLTASRAELESDIQERSAKLKQLEKEEDKLIEESRALQNTIKNLSKKKKYTGGSMVWPVPSSQSVTSYYGMRRHPILKKYKMHTGIDIDGNKNASIVAANSGTVIISGYKNGYGKTVVIDHGGGVTTLYAHCNKLLVSVGDEVKAGEVIAKVGSTGLSTGPHLHFEVRVDGETRNPLKGYLSN